MIYKEFNCHYCGKKVGKKVTPGGTHHYCNRKCYQSQVKKESTFTEEKCSKCDKIILRNNHQKRSSKTGLFFCSNLCKNVYIARKLRWSKNPYSHRGRVKEIFRQANYSCQKCGYNKDKRMLDIHHHDEDHHNNAWDNLRCVCSWCHMQHHRGVQKIGELTALFDRA